MLVNKINIPKIKSLSLEQRTQRPSFNSRSAKSARYKKIFLLSPLTTALLRWYLCIFAHLLSRHSDTPTRAKSHNYYKETTYENSREDSAAAAKIYEASATILAFSSTCTAAFSPRRAVKIIYRDGLSAARVRATNYSCVCRERKKTSRAVAGERDKRH